MSARSEGVIRYTRVVDGTSVVADPKIRSSDLDEIPRDHVRSKPRGTFH